MLGTFMLNEKLALFSPKFLKISEITKNEKDTSEQRQSWHAAKFVMKTPTLYAVASLQPFAPKIRKHSSVHTTIINTLDALIHWGIQHYTPFFSLYYYFLDGVG